MEASIFAAKEPPVSIGYECGLAPEPVWTRWWKEKNPCPLRQSNPGHAARSPLTEMSRLQTLMRYKQKCKAPICCMMKSFEKKFDFTFGAHCTDMA